MKRTLVLLAWVLAVAGPASAQSGGFKFDVGAGLGYLSFANDQQTEVSGELADLNQTYGFWGANVFADISEYFTLSSSVWLGLGKAHATGSFASTTLLDETATNSLLELEVAAVFKYPIAVGESLTFSPKVGLSDLFYLSGTVGGETPDTTGKQTLSPFSIVTGADVDYLFPNGVLLRFPIDIGWALNSRPNSEPGRYIASNTVSLRTGISVAYRLSGRTADDAPPLVPKPDTAPQTPAEKSADTTPAAPSKLPINIAFGGGTSYLVYSNNQKFTSSGIEVDSSSAFYSACVGVFADISDYFTASLGFRFGLGDERSTTSALGSTSTSTATNKIVNYEFGVEAKYPFAMGPSFSISPKVGFDALVYTAGTLGGTAPSTNDDKLLVGPELITLGADFNFAIDPHWFVRVPLVFGIGLNSKFSDETYTLEGVSYTSSNLFSFLGGINVGYKL